MKKKLSKLLAVLLGTMTLAVGVPAAAFADEAAMPQHTQVSVGWFAGNEYEEVLASGIEGVPAFMYTTKWDPSEADTLELPAEVEDGYGRMQTITAYVQLGADGKERKSYTPGSSVTFADIIGADNYTFHAYETYAMRTIDIVACAPDYAEPEKTPEQPAVTPAANSTEAAAAVSAPAAETAAPVDTRTAQQREIDEAKANGTWGIEYTTCQKCGYHNWTRQGNVYVCDTCGNTTTTVVGPKGVKGYVGSGAIAPVANAAAPETRYATAAQAQAAADKREAAYAAAVAALQNQIAAQNAAYLASLGK